MVQKTLRYFYQAAQSSPSFVSQLELQIERPREKDRNFAQGGRSFYFFDFDDNVLFLSTPLYIFHKETGAEVVISSGEFAFEQSRVGKSGPYKDYEIKFDDESGTFRCFRDLNLFWLERVMGKRQAFIEDIAAALGHPDFRWQGPSWSCFFHATYNMRPTAIITARGHHPDTIKTGIDLLVKRKALPQSPNYLAIYPVNHHDTRKNLGDTYKIQTVAQLKQAAIRSAVEKAISTYGYSAHHRFGMSDDDPKNIELISEEMRRLKIRYPEMSFFIIETQHGKMTKKEVLGHDLGQSYDLNIPQLSFI